MRRAYVWGLAGGLGLALAAWSSARVGLARGLTALSGADLVAVREYIQGFGAWAPVVSALLMQVQAVVAPLPSFPLMYANGLLFGTLWGGLLSWVSILASAILCFSLARAGGRPLVERLVSQRTLAEADRRLARIGPWGVLLLRLVPLTAFDLVSYAAGLTSMRLAPFTVATGLGMAPAVFLVAAAGELGLRPSWRGLWGLAAGAALIGVVLWLRRTATVSCAGRTPPAAAGGTAASGGPST